MWRGFPDCQCTIQKIYKGYPEVHVGWWLGIFFPRPPDRTSIWARNISRLLMLVVSQQAGEDNGGIHRGEGFRSVENWKNGVKAPLPPLFLPPPLSPATVARGPFFFQRIPFRRMGNVDTKEIRRNVELPHIQPCVSETVKKELLTSEWANFNKYASFFLLPSRLKYVFSLPSHFPRAFNGCTHVFFPYQHREEFIINNEEPNEPLFKKCTHVLTSAKKKIIKNVCGMKEMGQSRGFHPRVRKPTSELIIGAI